MKLSIVVNFHNMRREAERTLHSLSRSYQLDINDLEYEILAIDNTSSEPIEVPDAGKMQCGFRYFPLRSESPSPCSAINAVAQEAQGEFLLCSIDGARIFSPGILGQAMSMARVYPHPFVHTVNMHLGKQLQYLAMQSGYDQAVEDAMLALSEWQSNGYKLFDISCFGGAANSGFFHTISESNTLFLRKTDWLELGGFNEHFVSKGGGYCNAEIFSRFMAASYLTPVRLLGEATFHQIHGGTVTNASEAERQLLFDSMKREYETIVGRKRSNSKRSVVFFGQLRGPMSPAMT